MPPSSSSRNLVLALTAENENQALATASTGIGSEFIEHCYRHTIIDMLKPESAGELHGLLASQQVAFVYAFAGVGSRFALKTGENLWAAAKTPFISLWYDHPCYNYHQHIVDSPYVVQGYHLRDHIDARNKYLPTGSSGSVLLPGRYLFAPPPRKRSFKSRDKKILFAKTGVDPVTIAEEWKKHPPILQEVLWNLVEMAKKDRNIDLAGATAQQFKNVGESIERLDLFMGVTAAVDHYIRAWRSDRLARALLQHPADIVGRGWDYLRGGNQRAEILPPFPASEFYERIQNYRICANSHPLWRDGIHERAYFTICVGSISLTDRTEKSDEIFEGVPSYIGFEWQDDLADVIAMALKQAENDEADYIKAKIPKTNDLLFNPPDYIGAIEKAVAAVGCG